MATSIRHFGELQSTQSMNYRYDQLHRIAAAHASKWEGIWTTVEGSYNTSYAYDGNGNIQNLYRNNLEATTIDELYYHYDPVKKNRLDVVKDGGTAEGLNNANPYEYKYDQIGNLTQNLEDGIEDIEWNIYGKVEKVSKTNGTLIAYRYDGTGNRISKSIQTSGNSTYFITSYVRDASGNVMAIYTTKRQLDEVTQEGIYVKEIPIYGSSRLGQYRPKTDTKKTALGQRIYEFSNHLGNVLVTLSDNKVPQTDGTYESVVVSASDYYPFGMAMSERTYSNSEYRYGFNGKENDTDFGSDIQNFDARFYSGTLGKMFSVDPLALKYPSSSPYSSFNNSPLLYVDPDGRENIIYIYIGEGFREKSKFQVGHEKELKEEVLRLLKLHGVEATVDVKFVSAPVKAYELDKSDAYVHLDWKESEQRTEPNSPKEIAEGFIYGRSFSVSYEMMLAESCFIDDVLNAEDIKYEYQSTDILRKGNLAYTYPTGNNELRRDGIFFATNNFLKAIESAKTDAGITDFSLGKFLGAAIVHELGHTFSGLAHDKVSGEEGTLFDTHNTNFYRYRNKTNANILVYQRDLSLRFKTTRPPRDNRSINIQTYFITKYGPLNDEPEESSTDGN